MFTSNKTLPVKWQSFVHACQSGPVWEIYNRIGSTGQQARSDAATSTAPANMLRHFHGGFTAWWDHLLPAMILSFMAAVLGVNLGLDMHCGRTLDYRLHRAGDAERRGAKRRRPPAAAVADVGDPRTSAQDEAVDTQVQAQGNRRTPPPDKADGPLAGKRLTAGRVGAS